MNSFWPCLTSHTCAVKEELAGLTGWGQGEEHALAATPTAYSSMLGLLITRRGFMQCIWLLGLKGQNRVKPFRGSSHSLQPQ